MLTSKRRKRLSCKEKGRILSMLNDGSSVDEIVLAFGVSPSFVRKWRKSGPPKMKELGISKKMHTREACSTGYYKLVDEEVMKFVNESRLLQFPVTRDILKVQALTIRHKLVEGKALQDDVKAQLLQFKASDGWCSRFLSQNNLISKVLHGQAGSASVHESKDRIFKIVKH